MEDELLSVAQVAKRLGLRKETVRLYIAAGRLPALRIPGGFYRIRKEELDRFLRPVMPRVRIHK